MAVGKETVTNVNDGDKFNKNFRSRVYEGEDPNQEQIYEIYSQDIEKIASILGIEVDDDWTEIRITGEEFLNQIANYYFQDNLRTFDNINPEDRVAIMENMQFLAPFDFTQIQSPWIYFNVGATPDQLLAENTSIYTTRQAEVLSTFFNEVFLRKLNPDAFPDFSELPTLTFRKENDDSNAHTVEPVLELPKADFDISNTAELISRFEIYQDPNRILDLLEMIENAYERFSRIPTSDNPSTDIIIGHFDISPGNIGVRGGNIVFLDLHTASTINTHTTIAHWTKTYAHPNQDDPNFRRDNFEKLDEYALSKVLIELIQNIVSELFDDFEPIDLDEMYEISNQDRLKLRQQMQNYIQNITQHISLTGGSYGSLRAKIAKYLLRIHELK